MRKILKLTMKCTQFLIKKKFHFRQFKPQFSDDQKYYFVEYANRLTEKSEEELKYVEDLY